MTSAIKIPVFQNYVIYKDIEKVIEHFIIKL